MNDALRKRFTTQFASIASARVKRAIAELAANPTVVARELHSLAGEAGMLGLSEIADSAADLSTITREWTNTPPTGGDRLAAARKLRALSALIGKLEAPAEAPVQAAHPTTSSSALVVEDSELVAEELAEALQRMGFASTIAATFDAVVASLTAHVPDVVLLDANLPGVDIKKVCEQVRQHGRSSKIVLVSGVSDHELAQLARTVGADSHVSKLNGVTRVIEHVVSVVHRGAA